MEYLLLFGIFILSTLFIILLFKILFSSKLRTSERMNMIRETGNPVMSDDFTTTEEEKKRIKQKSKKSFMATYYEKKRKRLSQAYVLMKPEEFFLISVVSALIGFLLMYFLTKNLILAIFGGVLGFVIPDFNINSIKKKRGLKLNAQLPEALNILSNGLRAGLSFSQAVSVAGKDLESPIKDEFSKVIRDNTLGKSMEDALMDFTQRTDDEDVDMFVTAMIIQRQVGGNLAEILDTISNTIRERVKIKGEVRTLTAQSKLSAIVVGLLPVVIAMALFVMNPEYIGKLFTNPLGLVMLGAAVIMTLLGAFILMKMVNLEV